MSLIKALRRLIYSGSSDIYRYEIEIIAAYYETLSELDKKKFVEQFLRFDTVERQYNDRTIIFHDLDDPTYETWPKRILFENRKYFTKTFSARLSSSQYVVKVKVNYQYGCFVGFKLDIPRGKFLTDPMLLYKVNIGYAKSALLDAKDGIGKAIDQMSIFSRFSPGVKISRSYNKLEKTIIEGFKKLFADDELEIIVSQIGEINRIYRDPEGNETLFFKFVKGKPSSKFGKLFNDIGESEICDLEVYYFKNILPVEVYIRNGALFRFKYCGAYPANKELENYTIVSGTKCQDVR